MKIETHTLPNNIRLVHVPDKSDVAYLGAIINTGTRDELTNESGLAHLTEHMLFKGTSKRNSTQIKNIPMQVIMTSTLMDLRFGEMSDVVC